MCTIMRASGVAAALIVTALATNPAAAASLIYVSAANGSDGTCGFGTDPTLPCRSLFKAHQVANPGDVIQLEGGNYFSVTVTKSVTIHSANGGAAFGGETPCLTIDAGPADVVNLDGIICIAATGGTDAIEFNTGAKLRIRNSIVRGATDQGCGVFFQPNTPAELHIENSIISENGASGEGGGVCVVPRDGANVSGVIDRLTSENNRIGLLATANGASKINLLIQNSVFAANQVGIRSIRPFSLLRISNTSIYKNITGLQSLNGGQLISVGGNVLAANATDAFTTTEAKQ